MTPTMQPNYRGNLRAVFRKQSKILQPGAIAPTTGVLKTASPQAGMFAVISRINNTNR